MSISEFLNPLNKSVLEEVYIYPGELIAKDKFQNLIKTQHAGLPAGVLYEELKNLKVKFEYIGQYVSSSKLDYVLFILSLCTGLAFYYLYTKSTTESRNPSSPVGKTTFDDIIGLDSAKTALIEVLDYMMDEDKYRNRGARMRKGVLLYGPPGTGKTTLAKACANSIGIPFYACNAAEFCEIYVGMGPKKVRELFAKARSSAPCIVFIDELDALGSRTNENQFMMESANSEKNTTINQILSEIDGFSSSDKVLVIAATNRLEMVDKSLVRAGRFDAKINIPLPPLEVKVRIFKKYLAKTKHRISDSYIGKLLEKGQYGSGADIETLVNEAIYNSIRRDSEVVEEQDIVAVLKHY